jgi:hypothetical protein
VNPLDERQRLAALHEYRLLGAAAGETAAVAGELGAVVQLAAMVAGVYAQAGNAPYHREPADLGELVEQAITDLRGQPAGSASWRRRAAAPR